MILKLALAQQHTGCPRCNYMGCCLARQKHGEMLGHWLWCLQLLSRQLSPRRALKRLKAWWTELDYSKIEDVEVDGIDTRDYPDFCDAYICSATYKGRDMTDAELDRLNDDRDFVYQAVQDRLY